MKRCNQTVIRTFNKDNGNRYFCLTLCHRLNVRVSPRPHPTARVSCRNPDPSNRVRRVGASWTGSVPLREGPQRAARSPSVSVPDLVSPPCEDVSLQTDAVPSLGAKGACAVVSDSVAPKTSRIKRSSSDLRCLSQRPEPAKTRGMHRVERSAYLVSESQVALAVKDSLSRPLCLELRKDTWAPPS